MSSSLVEFIENLSLSNTYPTETGTTTCWPGAGPGLGPPAAAAVEGVGSPISSRRSSGSSLLREFNMSAMSERKGRTFVE